MSPLWRDEVNVYLAPGRVALARRARGLRPNVVSATDARVASEGARDVAPTLALLGQMLAEEPWQDADARVIVGDAWARFALVPWNGVWLDANERLGQAHYALGDAFGDAVRDWNVAVAEPAPGRASLACALRPDVTAGLGSLLPGARLRLASVCPQLVCAFNVWRRMLPPDAWFVSLEEGALAAVLLRDGGWTRVHTTRGGDWALELRRLQALGRLAGDEAAAAPPLYVDAPHWIHDAAPPDLGAVHWLDPRDVGPQDAHELALLQRSYA